MTRIYTVDFTNDDGADLKHREFYMSLDGAKNSLAKAGYYEKSPEDFDNNERARWDMDETMIFKATRAYIGFVEANE